MIEWRKVICSFIILLELLRFIAKSHETLLQGFCSLVIILVCLIGYHWKRKGK